MQSPQQLMDRWWAALASRDLDGVLDAFGADCHFVLPGMKFHGAEQMKPYVENYLRALPDFATEILESVASEEAIAFELRSTGTQTAPLATPDGEVPATGARVTFESCLYVKAKQGKITSFHTYFDHPEWVGPS
jgi:steroid delta-isomerase-like uncharacterized protein